MGVTCDTNENVKDIMIAFYRGLFESDDVEYSGTFAWIHMPRTTQSFSVTCRRGVTETLPIADLPTLLVRLRVEYCNLFGPIDLTALPPSLTYVNLAGNQFSGTLQFTSLPENLTYLILSDNRFEGLVNFSRLVTQPSHIDLSGNQLHATSHIPPFVLLKKLNQTLPI